MRDEATPRVFRMRWWTPDPHPCLGGCGTILQFPKAKRCPKCNRAHTGEKNKARYRERRERGVCVDCGRVPAVQRGGRCERHRERRREYARKAKAKKRRRNQKFVNCEICGALLRKNGNVKYCRPCSAKRAGAYQRIYAERRREKGLCVECGKIPPAKDRVCCEECLAKKSAVLRRIYNERKREGLCTECGRVPEGKTLRCDKCRLHKKRQDIRRKIEREG